MIDSDRETSNEEPQDSSIKKDAGGKHAKCLPSGVQDLLECPICMNSMCPPIYQCSNGHTICSLCKSRVRNLCPTCRGELGNIRCLALEKVARSVEISCKYWEFGCQDMLPYPTKIKHEQICNYRPFNCPYAGSPCSSTGDALSLVKHLNTDHKVDIVDGFTFSHRYIKSMPQEVDNAIWTSTIFNCYDQHFCLHFESFLLGNAPVYMGFLRFMGNEDEAKKFSYNLEVGSNGRKLTWQGIPRSIRDHHKKVRDSQDGLIIPRNLALFFSGGDRKELKLKVAGRIWKEQ